LPPYYGFIAFTLTITLLLLITPLRFDTARACLPPMMLYARSAARRVSAQRSERAQARLPRARYSSAFLLSA